MTVIHLIRAKYNKTTLERRTDDKLEAVCSFKFDQQKHYSQAAETLKVGVEWIRHLIDAFRQRDVDSEEHQLDVAQDDIRLGVRGRLQVNQEAVYVQGKPLTSLRQVLTAHYGCSEPLIFWDDAAALCMVDGDWHNDTYDKRPTEAALLRMAGSVEPRPSVYWATHGRGLRLVYFSAESFSAEELAAVAILSLLAIAPGIRCELKTTTRHPSIPVNGRHCSAVHWQEQTEDVSLLASWLGKASVSEDEIDFYLAQRGLERGKRYEHDRCPVDPGNLAQRQPCVVFDAGIYCHACSGRGVTLGHRMPGWFPYSGLIGSCIATPLRQCVDNYTHWEQARHVLTDATGLDERTAKACYAAALKLRHGVTQRIASVFAAGHNFIRYDGRWGTLKAETYTEDVTAILARLPACQYERDGELKLDAERIARFKQTIDIGDYGYHILEPIWGCRIYSQWLPLRDSRSIPIVLPTAALANESMHPFRPKYIPSRLRKEEQAWKQVSEVFPGSNRELVTLLIAAKGAAEGRMGLPPIIYISGPTSAAKSGSVALAAAICGDSNHDVPWTSNAERVRQALQEAKSTGSYCTFNEIIKEGKNVGRSVSQTLTFLLNLTPESLSHKLYIGPVQLGGLPVIVLTDTRNPHDLKLDAQLQRRLVHVSLFTKVFWESSLKAHGLHGIQHLRCMNPLMSSACDTIFSAVIDRFFRFPMTFGEIAAELGFTPLNQTIEAEEHMTLLQSFYQHVCKAKSDSQSERRFGGRGWKVIQRDRPGELEELWLSLADESQMSSEKCSEEDWQRVCGLMYPARFECRAHGNKVGVRFIHRINRKEYLVNEELQLEPGPNKASVCGPGDTIAAGLDQMWPKTIPGLPGD